MCVSDLFSLPAFSRSVFIDLFCYTSLRSFNMHRRQVVIRNDLLLKTSEYGSAGTFDVPVIT